MTNTKLTVADFFCGAGGFSEGFNQAGFNVVFGLDSWKPAIETHYLNHPDCTSVHKNILLLNTPKKIDEIVPDTDIIIGSPPCVSFSNSNKSGKSDKSLGIQLIESYLRIVLYKMTKKDSILKYWIMENVPNSFKFVKDIYTAKELGLDENLPSLNVRNKHILVASSYGSPQGRKRAICGDYIVPEVTHTKDTFVHIDKIMEKLGPPIKNNKKFIDDPSFDNISLPPSQVSDHFYDGEIPEALWKKAKRLKQDHGYMGKMDFPDRTNRLSRTIMATESFCSRESIIFRKENTNKYRAPTIRELSCLMGFPIDYQFSGNSSNTKHKQIGNAVCIHMSKALGDAIYKKEGLSFFPDKRSISTLKTNLNNLTTTLFSKYNPKPKKMNSKFHIHVPYLKINQLRVELDNTSSDFNKERFVWSCILHKGSGKTAKNTSLTTSEIFGIINSHKNFKHIRELFQSIMSEKLNDSCVFQKKNCNIDVDEIHDAHYSPQEVLDIVSIEIKKLGVADDKIKCSLLDTKLQYNNPHEYPIEILFALYLINKTCDNINQTH